LDEKVFRFLACPICRAPLTFEGNKTDNRFVRGHFSCRNRHMYQVKEEIGLFKDAKTSANEFKWEVDVADEKRYDEIRRQYDSYFRKDQRAAMQKMTEQLVSTVARSSEESDDVVLDVATGMGAFIVPFAEKSSNDTLIIGTDIDEKPLRGTMKKARKTLVFQK
jgi:uncharacterized protein YbaR (Trm112 family)